MTDTASCEPQNRGHRHEALFYAGIEDLMRAALGFLKDAVAAGEPTLVVLASDKITALARGARGRSGEGSFLGHGRSWQESRADHSGVARVPERQSDRGKKSEGHRGADLG